MGYERAIAFLEDPDHRWIPDAHVALDRIRAMPHGFYELGLMALAAKMAFEDRGEYGRVEVFPDDCPLETALLYIFAQDEDGTQGNYFWKNVRFFWVGIRLQVERVKIAET